MKYIPIYNVSDLSFCFFDRFQITLCSMNSSIIGVMIRAAGIAM